VLLGLLQLFFALEFFEVLLATMNVGLFEVVEQGLLGIFYEKFEQGHHGRFQLMLEVIQGVDAEPVFGDVPRIFGLGAL